jgi:hypothetical protein
MARVVPRKLRTRPTKRWHWPGAAATSGVGNAINILSQAEPDIATTLRLLNQSLAAFEAAGYVERQAVCTHNLGLEYSHSDYGAPAVCCSKSVEIGRRTGADHNTLFVLALVEHEMGHSAAARAYLEEGDGLA